MPKALEASKKVADAAAINHAAESTKIRNRKRKTFFASS
jgi:hypothetical protein